MLASRKILRSVTVFKKRMKKEDLRQEALQSDPESKKDSMKAQYWLDPESKKETAKAHYWLDPESKKDSVKAYYDQNRELILASKQLKLLIP